MTTKTVILSPDMVGPINNGGIGTFATQFSKLLRQNGHEVAIVFTGPTQIPRPKWQPMYDELGIEVIDAHPPFDARRSVGNYWFLQHSESACHAIPADTQIVYTQDWRGNAFQLLRRRRQTGLKSPTIVTVLHSPSAWLRDGMHMYPDEPEEHTAIDFVESYAAQYSDFIASPSDYMLQWVQSYGWRLPSSENIRVLGYPFTPDNRPQNGADVVSDGQQFKKIVFFGRLETRKGIELFVDALSYLCHHLHYPLATQIDEIVLLGKHEGQHRYETLHALCADITTLTTIPVTPITDYSTQSAQNYLHEHAAESLVVMPSLVDNFPFTVLEATLIPNLNLLTTNNGGMPEILGNNADDQLCEPFVKPLANKLKNMLSEPPKPNHKLSHYDWEAANQNWLSFHEAVAAFSQKTPAQFVPARPKASVDICIPHHNHGQYLTQLLEALVQQTYSDFGVIVVDDASTDEQSRQQFLALRQQHPDWRFLSNAENQGLSATRNIAVQHSNADYIIFVDADNVPTPHMVEQMLSAIQHSGADCLTCYALAFKGDGLPYDLNQLLDMDSIINRSLYQYKPLGASLLTGIFVNSFGDANFIIRRQVLEKIGGFRLDYPAYRHIVGEDHALLANLCLDGYDVDVIPEFLFFYRYRHDSLFRTTDTYANMQRVHRVYQEKLKTLGLEHLMPVTYGLYQRALELPGSVSHTNPDWMARRVPWRHLLTAMLLKVKNKLKR